jgi:anti-sigma regulatory factor (Ser/Thr protein kinase)
MEIAADEVNVSKARRFVVSAVDDWGIPRRDDVALVTSELVSNALDHASHPVTVAVDRGGILWTGTGTIWRGDRDCLRGSDWHFGAACT